MRLSDRIGHRMKLHDLHVLMTVAEAGTMGKAAQRLNTTQPAVSRSVAELEHALGVRLLERSRRGVELTQYGRALLDCSTAVFDDLRQGVKTIRFLADPTVGELLVGCDSPRMSGLLPAIVNRFRQQFPRVDVHARLIPPVEEQHRALRERKLELYLGRLTDSVDPTFDTEVLFQERAFVVAGSKNPWSRRRKIKLADLSNEPWTLPTRGSAADSMVADAFRAAGIPFPPIGTVSGTVDMHGPLVAKGPFLAIYPGSLLQFGPKELAIKVLPVDLPLPPSPVGVVTLKDRMLSPLAQQFINCAREVVKPLARAQ